MIAHEQNCQASNERDGIVVIPDLGGEFIVAMEDKREKEMKEEFC